MAAARGDQVAETGSNRQPAAPIRQASDVAPGSALVTHTAAPERPANSDPHDSAKEASCSQEGTGVLDTLGRDSAAAAATTAAADGLTASTESQISSHSRLEAGVSAPEPAEEKAPQASRQEDEEEEMANPTTSQGNFQCSDDSQTPPQHHNEDSTDQLVTEPPEGPPSEGYIHGEASITRDKFRSQQSARKPLAAVQEAVTPTLGMLPFKPAVHGKDRHGRFLVHLRVMHVSWHDLPHVSKRD